MTASDGQLVPVTVVQASDDDGGEARTEVLVALENERVELRQALHELQEVVVATPRQQLRKYALSILFGGFLAGVVLGVMSAPASSAPTSV